MRIDRTDLGGEQGSTQTGEQGTHPERQKLGGHFIDPHRLGDILILAQGHPGAAQVGILETGGDEPRQEDASQDQVIKFLLVVEDESTDRWLHDALNSLRSSQQRFQPVREHHDADDLTEAQRNNGQVITAQAEDRQTQANTGENRHDQGDGCCCPEAEV